MIKDAAGHLLIDLRDRAKMLEKYVRKWDRLGPNLSKRMKGTQQNQQGS